MEEFLPHCGELPSAHVNLYLVVHFVFNEGVVNRNLPHCRLPVLPRFLSRMFGSFDGVRQNKIENYLRGEEELC